MVTCRRNQHTPAESVTAEAPEAWRNHRAHMELIVQQVWVPRQTSSTGHRGAHHPSVTDAPAVVALRLGLWRHTKQTRTCVPKQCRWDADGHRADDRSPPFTLESVRASLQTQLSACVNCSNLNIWVHVLQLAHVFTCHEPSNHYHTHTRAWTRRYKHRERDPRTLATVSLLLTKATVRPTVATPAVTHFLPSVCDQPTRTVILTRVGAAHWTHEFQTGYNSDPLILFTLSTPI